MRERQDPQFSSMATIKQTKSPQQPDGGFPEFYERAWQVVRTIPRGKVATCP